MWVPGRAWSREQTSNKFLVLDKPVVSFNLPLQGEPGIVPDNWDQGLDPIVQFNKRVLGATLLILGRKKRKCGARFDSILEKRKLCKGSKKIDEEQLHFSIILCNQKYQRVVALELT